jgi:hypothetical protein
MGFELMGFELMGFELMGFELMGFELMPRGLRCEGPGVIEQGRSASK